MTNVTKLELFLHQFGFFKKPSLLLHCSVGRGFFGGAEGTEKWVGDLHRSAASLASADPLGRANCRPIAEVFLNSKDV